MTCHNNSLPSKGRLGSRQEALGGNMKIFKWGPVSAVFLALSMIAAGPAPEPQQNRDSCMKRCNKEREICIKNGDTKCEENARKCRAACPWN